MKKFYFIVTLICCTHQLQAQLNIQFRSQLTYPGQSLANIWGYVDTLGNEYALVGTSTGVSIVDVTNPVAPIQKFMVTGITSSWREIKTWGKFAYVTTEGCCNGLQIINLSNLPASVSVSYWTGSGAIAGLLQRAHSLHIDNGYLYLNGSNLFGGACIIASLANPLSPAYMSNTQFAFSGTTRYTHDCYVRNDTLYGANIYAGFFTIVNVANKSAPVLLNTQITTNAFTHNCWLSDDGRKLFTTDETSNSFLTAYDVSSPGNVTYLDRVQSNPGSNVIVHNTYIRNDYAVTSWYKDGVAIVDVSRPDNMIITGFYDTYSQGTGSGFNGCWGVYPYLPSGNIVASDIDNGLFVLTPTYNRGCYLEGMLTNSCNGTAVSGATVQISGGNNDISSVTGSFKTGMAVSGNYTVTISKAGFFTAVFNNVALNNGQVTPLNISLTPITGITGANPVVTNASCNGTNNGQVSLSPSGGSLPYSYAWSSGHTGSVASGLTAGTYTATVTDAAGCSLSAIATVNQPAALNAAASSNSPLCKGSTLNLGAGGGFSAWSWTGPNGFASASQNPTLAGVTGSASGTYAVTVTGPGGCTASQTLSVTVSDISISALISPVTCYNTPTASIDISLTGGVGTYSYTWSNGSHAQDLSAVKAGTYTVTVTDGIGCTKTASWLLTQAASSLLLSTSKTNIRCYGSSSGIAGVSPSGGIAPYAYSWNTVPVQTTASISLLAAGSYTVTVTDAAGCIKTATVSITQPPQLLAVSTQTNVTFPGGNDGTASVTPSGGTPPYTYLWNTFPAQSTSSVSNLYAGFYKCRVTDSKNCIKNVAFTITEPFSLINNNQRNGELTYYPNPAHDMAWIRNPDPMSESTVNLYDISGRLVYSSSVKGMDLIGLPVSTYERGVYVVEIKMTGRSNRVRLIMN